MNIQTPKDAVLLIRRMLTEIQKSVIGKDEIILRVILAMIAQGHVLIEDIPGVGKTTLALSLSKVLSLDYNRMQFTPDVLPSDVTGFSLYQKDTDQFVYQPGVAMCNLFLADEINRTSSKTQSALLELMEEGSVTVDGITHPLPKPFLVIATQNPVGSAGTQMLPESQLDRFMLQLEMGYPSEADEVAILRSRLGANPLKTIESVISAEDLITLQNMCKNVHVDDSILSYVASLANATRKHKSIALGLSPRGSLALLSIARATALAHGRDYVVGEDVSFLFYEVSAHRIVLNASSRQDSNAKRKILNSIVESVPKPRITG